nr:MAG TPA_asm: jmjN domain [Bacteriophage sp.]DAW86473.1 MAG TPA: jmjN domain [Bacteriophage sp.]
MRFLPSIVYYRHITIEDYLDFIRFISDLRSL